MRRSSTSVTKSTQRVVTATLIAVVLALTLIGAWGRAAGAPAADGAGGQVVHHIHISLAHAYASLGELKGASQLVVRGVVTTQRNEVDSNGVPSTVSTVQVGQPLWSRGSSAPTVLVRQLGASELMASRGSTRIFRCSRRIRSTSCS